jgi:methionine-R-sulfoxide reductase
MIRFFPLPFLFALLFACSESRSDKPASLKPDKNGRIRLSDAEWEKILPKNTYLVTRENGTERPYTGKLLNNHAKGVYSCYSCGLPLFKSDAKFESNTGWPSFFRTIDRSNVVEKTESDGRVEVRCARCDAHLGHVFTDGPKPTGLRYCMNSVALRFEGR